jgi:hypothetical protein
MYTKFRLTSLNLGRTELNLARTELNLARTQLNLAPIELKYIFFRNNKNINLAKTANILIYQKQQKY